MSVNATDVSRRDFLGLVARSLLLAGLGGLAAQLVRRQQKREWVWQLDPRKCQACGKCATKCVLSQSAVKCVHAFPMCGYCDLCTGYFMPNPNSLGTGAENLMCPVGAVKRRFVEEPFFEYTIDEQLCIGCGRCVKGCRSFGNGSLHLQVRHDRCLHCNECAIAKACPAQAYRRVPAASPYLFKDQLPADGGMT